MISSALLAVALSASSVLTLEQALETARSRQPSLRQAAANTEAAKARVMTARAPLLPQVTGSARYTLTTANVVPQAGTTTGAGGSTTGLANFTNASLTVNQLLWDFGQSWNRLDAAQASLEAVHEDERTNLTAAMFAVRSAFFAARANKELLVVAKETLANQERHLQQIQGFVEVGTRPAIDLAQARTDRANARLSLISAQNNYLSARAQLNQAMGVEGPSDFDVSDDRLGVVPEEVQPLDETLAAVMADRSEVRALAQRVRAQEETAAAARGAYGPSVSLTGGVSGGSRDTLLSGNVNVIGVSVNWNLFGGFADHARVQEANANLTALNAQAESLRQQIRLELEQAQLGVKAAVESQLAAEEALTGAKERLGLAEGRYEMGVGNIIELGDAQLALTNAAANRVQSDYNLSAARAQLLKSLGRP